MTEFAAQAFVTLGVVMVPADVPPSICTVSMLVASQPQQPSGIKAVTFDPLMRVAKAFPVMQASAAADGFRMKLTALDVPPQDPGFVTTTGKLPAVARSLVLS